MESSHSIGWSFVAAFNYFSYISVTWNSFLPMDSVVEKIYDEIEVFLIIFVFFTEKNRKFEKVFTTFTWRSNRRYMLITKRWHKSAFTLCSPERVKGRERLLQHKTASSLVRSFFDIGHWPFRFIKNQDGFNYSIFLQNICITKYKKTLAYEMFLYN